MKKECDKREVDNGRRKVVQQNPKIRMSEGRGVGWRRVCIAGHLPSNGPKGTSVGVSEPTGRFHGEARAYRVLPTGTDARREVTLGRLKTVTIIGTLRAALGSVSKST